MAVVVVMMIIVVIVMVMMMMMMRMHRVYLLVFNGIQLVEVCVEAPYNTIVMIEYREQGRRDYAYS